MKKILFFTLFFSFQACAQYPKNWWKPIKAEDKKSWEILPQEAKKGEVILSKRTELGVFSNLGLAPFDFEEIRYESVEALWQSLKYPDDKIESDPRKGQVYPYTRDEVFHLSGFESKKAGDAANKIMKANKIKWVSYKGKIFNYKDKAKGSKFHYDLIYKATKAKINQNPKLKKLLLKTKGLKLLPDHKIRKSSPASYFYNKILMKIRVNLK